MRKAYDLAITLRTPDKKKKPISCLIHTSAYSQNIIINVEKNIIATIHNIIDNENKIHIHHQLKYGLEWLSHIYFLRVSDTGCGFDTKKLNLLFQPFNQGIESETRQGLGLGLSIVKSYLKAMKGSISARSKINEGSTFMVRVPMIVIKKES